MRSVMPRRTISSASSRWLHWLIGRPEPLGCSQASARIWHTCSALKRGCTPGRGASASRLATLTSSSGMPRQRDPAPPPQAHGLNIHRDLLGDSRVAVPHRRQQHHPRASHQRLARLVGTTPGAPAHAAVPPLNTICGGFGPGMLSTSVSPRWPILTGAPHRPVVLRLSVLVVVAGAATRCAR